MGHSTFIGTIKSIESKEYNNFIKHNFKLLNNTGEIQASLAIFKNEDEEAKLKKEGMLSDFKEGSVVKVLYYTKDLYNNILSIEDAQNDSEAMNKLDVETHVINKKAHQSAPDSVQERIFKSICLNSAVSLLSTQCADMNFEYLTNNMPKRIFELANEILKEGKKTQWFK